MQDNYKAKLERFPTKIEQFGTKTVGVDYTLFFIVFA